MPDLSQKTRRPKSPNIQIYRPQLTSVLSIANRLCGIFLSVGAIGLVLWLVAAALGPVTYANVQQILSSSFGQVAMFLFVFTLFFHLLAGIRHLAWDAGYGFKLSQIYVSGWSMVAASVVLTVITWSAYATLSDFQ